MACALVGFSTHNMSEHLPHHGGQTHATCCAQQCCNMLRQNVAIIWPGLANTGPTMLRYVALNCCDCLAGTVLLKILEQLNCLRAFVMTCVHFSPDQNNLHRRRVFKFLTVCAPNPSPSKLSGVHCNLLANEIQDMTALKWVFMQLAFWPPNPSIYTISTCSCLRILANTCESIWNKYEPWAGKRNI